MTILVLNSGSSTLKFALFDESASSELTRGMVDWGGSRESAILTLRSPPTNDQPSCRNIAGHGDAVQWILASLAERGFHDIVSVVGHRVVHGGVEFHEPTLIDDRVCQALQQISELAPLHNPPAIAAIEAARVALPNAAHAAVFDTAFFSKLPPQAFLYPVPYEWYEEYGIRRFGFHGISHAYCTHRAADLLGRAADQSLRLVICHLGNGCSATAVCGDHAVATTMGFTPLEGLMMGSRSGSIDPSILIHLLNHHGFDAQQLQTSLNRRSGLLGVSGVSSDFRQVEQAANAGNERAGLAITMFVERIRATVGALAVTLGGIDALVFTAGIGEHSSQLRSQVCKGLQCLGLQLDEATNQDPLPDSDIAQTQSTGRILVIRTCEERMIARESQQLAGKFA